MLLMFNMRKCSRMARISRKYDKIDSVISKLKAYSTLFQVYKHNIDQKQKNIEFLP